MSPAIAIASRRPAQAIVPIGSGRYVYVTTIQTSGSAGNSAASIAKITRRMTRLPAGPSVPKSAVRSSSNEAIGGLSSGPRDGPHRDLKHEGPALCGRVVVQRVRPRDRIHRRHDKHHGSPRVLLSDPIDHRRREEMMDRDDPSAPVRGVVDPDDLRVPPA